MPEPGRSILSRVLKDITPPVLLRGLRFLLRARAGGARGALGAETLEGDWGERDADWYDRIYEQPLDYQGHYTTSRYYFLWAVIADRILRSGGRDVLDIGCGPGQFASLLRDKGLSHYRGVDFSPRAVALARTQCPNFDFTVEDARTSRVLSENECDVVVALEFLEHVAFDREVLGRIRPGVSFYGTVPNFAYTSHVRHFETPEAVGARYAEFFTGFEVEAFLGDEEDLTYYLFQGVRR